jgi:hypothetical protein
MVIFAEHIIYRPTGNWIIYNFDTHIDHIPRKNQGVTAKLVF